MSEKFDIFTWKQIADALGESESSAKRRWKKSQHTPDRMPVVVNGRVKANKVKLLEWAWRQE